MAKTDSFFIRASVTPDATNYVEEAIDLGAYVDALGKTVLRIHNISVQFGTATGGVGVINPNAQATTAFQLTTQSQTAMVSANDKSTISTGRLIATSNAVGNTELLSESLDIAPQHYTNGYLVGVEQIYLATDSLTNPVVDKIFIVLECTSETLSQSAAMALALSQQ